MSDQPKQSLYGESNAPDVGQDKPLEFMELISGVFSEPVETFKRLSKMPQWVGAMLLIIAFGLVFSIAWLARVDLPEFLRMTFERAQPNLSSAQLDQAVEATVKITQVSTIAGGLFGVPVMIFFLGLLYWAVGLISGEDAKRRPSYQHGLVVAVIPRLATVPYMLLGTIMAFINPVGTFRPDQIVPSSLEYWIQSDNPKLSALYSSIDLFQLFQYALIFIAAKYALKAKTWGAALCVALTLLAALAPVLFAR